MLDLLICIDDTDNLESIGTGKLASFMAQELEYCLSASCSLVTRHQLFVHEDIPYTSHNSSMCFAARIRQDRYPEVLDFGAEFLWANSAPDSDPGLCVAKLNNGLNRQSLVQFGCRAKKRVFTKDEAYSLAHKLGIHLSEHGGTGDGVIGALAGTGLRLSGNDGRFRGWTSFEAPDGLMTVSELCSQGCVDSVQTVEGEELSHQEVICLVPKVKTVLLEGKSVVLVEKTENPSIAGTSWKVLPKEHLKAY